MREKIKKLTPKFLIRIYQRARYLAVTALFFACRIFPLKKNLVVFCSVWGYGDNARYVAEELIDRKRAGRDAGMELIFITNHPGQVPENLPIRALKTNSPAAVLALARAAVWVENNRKEAYIRKRRGQYYIQLWHGGIALKKIEGDCEEALGASYIRRARKDSANTDLFVSNSTFCTRMYRRAFWANCEILECGSPRNDRFVRGMAGYRDKPFAQRIAIYAPTYRGTGKNYCDFNAGKLRAALAGRFGGEWEILVRLHPLVAGQHEFSGKDGVRDISGEPDLYSFLYYADVLITDYSNTMFEFCIAKKPVFLYADDLENYKRERGLYFDYLELPFPKAFTEEELYAAVQGYEGEKYVDLQQEFLKSAGLKESGRAAAADADRIEKIIKS